MSLSINFGLIIKCLICGCKANVIEGHNVKTRNEVDRSQVKNWVCSECMAANLPFYCIEDDCELIQEVKSGKASGETIDLLSSLSRIKFDINIGDNNHASPNEDIDPDIHHCNNRLPDASMWPLKHCYISLTRIRAFL